jgi:hypothetical protein
MTASMRTPVLVGAILAVAMSVSVARAQTPDAPPPPSGKPMKISGVLFAAAGVILIGGGIGLSMRAQSAWDDIDDARGQGLPWTPELQSKYDGAENDETYATVFYVAGGMTIVAGAVFYWMGVRRDSRDRFVIAPTRGGATATITWSF